MFLIDAPILLALRESRRGGSSAVSAWAGRTPRHRMFVSAVTLMTLYRAAAIAGDRSAAEGGAWREWLDGPVSTAFDGRILPVDPAVARRRARLALSDDADALIAATALEHGLTLVTGRTAAFRGARLKLLDPARQDMAGDGDEGDWQQAARSGSRWLKTLFVRG
ncbi:PIN domain-containing protein [Sphingomonas sp. BGYR3]|uniref:PIN domain-containing protein n=1 Tax=Sphingomonas sp. BGYR3 TaxID=2975483 RepID=UPI0021A35F30|nr:PIN domain-containing protein [Sphingomonas sp. BGYR3]MDG5489296.1 PIN domain-containing protein [Sphingomonas sp. BGYR3]